jgi:hypothetical protein
MTIPRPVRQFVVVVAWVTALITATGAILGAAIWPLVGMLAGTATRPDALVLTGAKTLGFYFFLWAPGTGFVVALIREWRRRHPEGNDSVSRTKPGGSTCGNRRSGG